MDKDVKKNCRPFFTRRASDKVLKVWKKCRDKAAHFLGDFNAKVSIEDLSGKDTFLRPLHEVTSKANIHFIHLTFAQNF